MTNNFLILNSDKTHILLIGAKNSTQNVLDYNLQLDGCPVPSSTVKNLGIILVDKMNELYIYIVPYCVLCNPHSYMV